MATDQTNLAPTCVNHPKVETRLTCSSCGDPICTRCMVATAVGQKCPRCARQSGRAKGNPETALLARAFGVGLAASAAAVLGLAAVVALFGGDPLTARLLLFYALSGGIAFARASGIW
jgi:hypothetical protein